MPERQRHVNGQDALYPRPEGRDFTAVSIILDAISSAPNSADTTLRSRIHTCQRSNPRRPLDHLPVLTLTPGEKRLPFHTTPWWQLILEPVVYSRFNICRFCQFGIPILEDTVTVVQQCLGTSLVPAETDNPPVPDTRPSRKFAHSQFPVCKVTLDGRHCRNTP